MLILQIYLFKLRSVYFNAKFGLYLLFNVLGFGPTALTVKERTKPAVLTQGVNDQFVDINVSEPLTDRAIGARIIV